MDRKKLGIAGGLILLVCIGICAGIFFRKKNIEWQRIWNLESSICWKRIMRRQLLRL